MIVREAKSKDIDGMAELHMGLAKYEKRFDPLVQATSGAKTEWKRWVGLKLKDAKCKSFVAEDGKKPIGYALGWLDRKPAYWGFVRFGYLCDCFVLKEYRRRGIGKLLAKRMISWFKSKGIKIIELGVYSQNKNAVKVWTKLGFDENEKTMRMYVE